MGRARGYDASHAATSGNIGRFDAVLGARRGSAPAQATRDAQEVYAREDARIAEMIAELNLSSGAGTAIDLLVTAHRSGGAVTGTPEYEKLCTDLIATQGPARWSLESKAAFRELAAVAVHGDPEHWPGLTAPVVDALGTHLQAKADDGADNSSNVFRAQIMVDALRVHGSSLEQYERLAPALKGLAELLHYMPQDGADALARQRAKAARQMAETLRDAPTQALLGPLQPLVQAFGQRIRNKKTSPGERRVLEQLLASRILPTSIVVAFAV